MARPAIQSSAAGVRCLIGARCESTRSKCKASDGRSDKAASAPPHRRRGRSGRCALSWRFPTAAGAPPSRQAPLPPRSFFGASSPCPVFASTDFQNIPDSGMRFLPSATSRSGTRTNSVSHWLTMKLLYPAIALSTARAPSRWPMIISEKLGCVALKIWRGSLVKMRTSSKRL